MKIERMETEDIAVLRLSGDVDELGVKELRRALTACMMGGHTHVVLNLAGVAFLSYMAVGVLVERLRQFRASQGDILLANMNMYADQLLRMVGVKSLFQTYDTEAQAVKVFEEAA